MNRDRVPVTDAAASASQRLAGFVLAAVVIAVGLWILYDFLQAFAWAGVLAIALWPLYRRLLRLMPARSERILGPALATIGVAIVVIGPLVLLGIAVARESHLVLAFIAEARHHGLPAPRWLHDLPLVGPTLFDWWRDHLSSPETAEELFGRIDLRTLALSARQFGGEILHRLTTLAFTLLTLLFLFRDGARLAEELRQLSDRLLGPRGERIARQMIAAVHGTVSGLVLLGLAEGILLGACYLAVGLPYPASIGAITGVAAVVPFAAPTVYGFAGVYLLAVGNTIGGIVVIAFGSAVVFVADHFVRPVLIGGAARLPFLLVLLGILGGLETLGLLGLFVGPAAMAAFVALWHEWTEAPAAATVMPPPHQTARRGAAERRRDL